LSAFDPSCQRCPRLAANLAEVRERHPDYHAAPVPCFGSPDARLLIVGLAPGMHGANRSGRPFTGDASGRLLFEVLFETGFANRPRSCRRGDGLQLLGCRLTNAVKCLPPDNKPVGAEINTCNIFLANELDTMPKGSVVLALGGIAHRAIVKARGYRQVEFKFAHEALHDLGDLLMLDSYHCSRYNTNTRRLTTEMFASVFSKAKALLGK